MWNTEATINFITTNVSQPIHLKNKITASLRKIYVHVLRQLLFSLLIYLNPYNMTSSVHKNDKKIDLKKKIAKKI